MALVESVFHKFFADGKGVAWAFFVDSYPPRRKHQRQKQYEAEREAAYREWVASLPSPED